MHFHVEVGFGAEVGEGLFGAGASFEGEIEERDFVVEEAKLCFFVGENGCLFACDAGQAIGEMIDVLEGDSGEKSDVWWCCFDKFGDLPRFTHPHFEDQDLFIS